MQYHDEWLKKEAADELDELYHRSPEAEYLFYRAVATGDVDTVRENCSLGKFLELERTYRLSDFYIQKLDDAHTWEDVCRIHDDMVLDFAEKCEDS